MASGDVIFTETNFRLTGDDLTVELVDPGLSDTRYVVNESVSLQVQFDSDSIVQLKLSATNDFTPTFEANNTKRYKVTITEV